MSDADEHACPGPRLLVLCADMELSAALAETLAASFTVPVDCAPD